MLTFGIYPGGLGVTDGDQVTPGPPEDPDKIEAALRALHGDKPFLVRGYTHYADATRRAGRAPAPHRPEAPPNPARYATGARRLDLVACFREPGADLTGWLAFLREQLRAHGPRLAALQVTEEPNHAGPGGDGGFPAVRDALVTGVVEAKREALRLGLDVRIGCNATLDFDPEQRFWTDLGRRGGTEFRDALDYVGLDFFPDVFQPVPADRLPAVVAAVLTGFREQSLAAAGIPESVPVHITEHGWATGPGRSYRRQAEVLDRVVGVVAEHANRLNIDTYEHFALRDADSDNPDPVFQLGLLRSDYTPKPAFETYRRLIASGAGRG
ncbi:hypothetical protein [Actinoplanes teichomyceticus]|uniref:Uncharacterized protein n=1 Tax=Actinoplanes teichomyceticus TaxID=1867 RepID=A0A561WA60_ACTTI|nr:hypothetical protein [Actinoplanes teichomyceticus]TWG20750.1 hypothetical protein FHX34_103279 [Actinoplanes teichomyceticus]GIF14406.1 hypothetical protein Ate01nite_44380 [Actinoplanes teichomyceticus]